MRTGHDIRPFNPFGWGSCPATVAGSQIEVLDRLLDILPNRLEVPVHGPDVDGRDLHFRDEGGHWIEVYSQDGDVIKNELRQGEPLELGFERYTGNTYGNKEFLMNAVNYMLDDTGLIDIRSKEINIAFLDQVKASAEREKWQLINLAMPLILLAIFGFAFNFFRKRKYVK